MAKLLDGCGLCYAYSSVSKNDPDFVSVIVRAFDIRSIYNILKKFLPGIEFRMVNVENKDGKNKMKV